MLFPAKKTVDGVLSAFTKTIADLRAVAAENEDDAKFHEEQINQAKMQLEAARLERTRALAAASKLEALLGSELAATLPGALA